MSAIAKKASPAARKLGDIAVIGGGIGGLAAAYFLSKEGARVTLYEASDQLGGLGTFFAHQDVYFDRFYHCMLPSDQHLIGLLRDIKLEERIYWKQTSFGVMCDRKLYELNTPLDLLRFDVLSPVDRLRVGLTGLWGKHCSPKGLDDVTCVEWLSRLSGRRAFDVFWRPLLQAKFGDRYASVPALWFWTRFNREKGEAREQKGYIRGGYRRITQQLAELITSMGGQIKLEAPIETLDLAQDRRPYVRCHGQKFTFDRVLCTTPVPLVQQLTNGGAFAPVTANLDSTLDMQGVVSAVLMLRRSLTKHYWIAVLDESIAFQGIVETSTLLDASDRAGVHLVYLMNYVHRTDDWFSKSDAYVLDAYRRGLIHIFPDLHDDDIIQQFVFRSPYVEPLYTQGYLRRRPPMVLVPGQVYLSSTAQAYPEVTSWNAATGLARSVVNELLGQS